MPYGRLALGLGTYGYRETSEAEAVSVVMSTMGINIVPQASTVQGGDADIAMAMSAIQTIAQALSVDATALIDVGPEYINLLPQAPSIDATEALISANAATVHMLANLANIDASAVVAASSIDIDVVPQATVVQAGDVLMAVSVVGIYVTPSTPGVDASGSVSIGLSIVRLDPQAPAIDAPSLALQDAIPIHIMPYAPGFGVGGVEVFVSPVVVHAALQPILRVVLGSLYHTIAETEILVHERTQILSVLDRNLQVEIYAYSIDADMGDIATRVETTDS